MIVGLADLQRTLEGVLDLNIQPSLEGARHKTSRDEEEQEGGHERQRDKGQNQTDPKTRSQDPPLPLKDELHDVSDYQKDQEDKQNNVNIEQEEKGDVVAKCIGGRDLGELDFEKSEKQHCQSGDQNHQPFALSPLGLLLAESLLQSFFYVGHFDTPSNRLRGEKNKRILPPKKVKNKGEEQADEETRCQRKIESKTTSLDVDIARKMAQPGDFRSDREDKPHDHQENAQKYERLTEALHPRVLKVFRIDFLVSWS